MALRLLEENFDCFSKFLVLLKEEGMAALEESQPSEGNLSGNDDGIDRLVDHIIASVRHENGVLDILEIVEILFVGVPKCRARAVLADRRFF